jgi:hypothetical protein
LNILYVKSTVNNRTDSTRIDYYPTGLDSDSPGRLFRTNPPPSAITKVKRNFFEAKIEPGETLPVNIVCIVPYSEINKWNKLPLSQGYYSGLFDFLFCSRINRIVGFKLNNYFLERMI